MDWTMWAALSEPQTRVFLDFANCSRSFLNPQIVVRDASKEALTELRKSKILARTVTLADEFTSKYNDKVADALAGEKTGVFGTKL